MPLRNQISAAAGIPQKRSRAFFHQTTAIHRLCRDSVSVGFRTAGSGGLLDFLDDFFRHRPLLLSSCPRGRERRDPEGNDRGEDDAGFAHGNLLLIGRPDEDRPPWCQIYRKHLIYGQNCLEDRLLGLLGVAHSRVRSYMENSAPRTPRGRGHTAPFRLVPVTSSSLQRRVPSGSWRQRRQRRQSRR